MGDNNMPDKRQYKARKPFAGFTNHRWGVAVLVVLALVATGLLIRSFLMNGKGVSRETPVRSVVQKSQEPVDASSEIDGKYYGLCKKNNIHSVEDFRTTVRNDPVLAAHFAGFNWDNARLGKQDKPVWTYVSYRKGEVVRRTTRAVRLPKGDGYVTDGTHMVRTYCCNDYVAAPAPRGTGPEDPVERVDAPPRRLNKPESADDLPQQVASWSPEDDPTHVTPETLNRVPRDLGLPLFWGPGHSSDPSRSPDDPGFGQYSSPKPPPNHVVTPEPGTFFLLGAGLGAFGLFSLFLRRRAKSPESTN